MQGRWLKPLALAAVAAVLSMLIWMAERLAFSPAPVGSAAETPPALVMPQAASTQAAVAEPVAPRASTAVVQSPPENDLMRKLMAASDWRVFAEWAKQHPELGGLYFASVAVNACGHVRSTLRTSVPQQELLRDSGQVAHARAAARATLTARCGSFTDDEIALTEPGKLRAQGRQSGDRLAIAWSDLNALLMRASTREERTAAFESALATGNPELMLTAGLMLAASGQAVVGGATAGDPEMTALAWNLAACSFGADCSVKGMNVLLDCAFYGNCYESSAESMRQTAIREFGEDGWQRIQALAARIATDVRNRQASSFIAADSPKRDNAPPN